RRSLRQCRARRGAVGRRRRRGSEAVAEVRRVGRAVFEPVLVQAVDDPQTMAAGEGELDRDRARRHVPVVGGPPLPQGGPGEFGVRAFTATLFPEDGAAAYVREALDAGQVGRVLARRPRLPLVIAHPGLPEYREFLDLADRYGRVRLDVTMAFTDFTEEFAP